MQNAQWTKNLYAHCVQNVQANKALNVHCAQNVQDAQLSMSKVAHFSWMTHLWILSASQLLPVRPPTWFDTQIWVKSSLEVGQGLGSALKGPLFTLWTSCIFPWMDAINMCHECDRKLITSRYCYAARILLGESSFLFESFKHYSKGHSTHILRGLAFYFFTIVTFHCMNRRALY